MDLEENRVSLVDGDIYTQISRSDLLISNASGTVFDSIAMGIPVAQFVKDDSFFFNNIPGIVEAKNFHCFRNYRELSFYVSKLIDIHFSSEQFYARPDEKIIDQFYSKVTRSGVLKLLGIQE